MPQLARSVFTIRLASLCAGSNSSSGTGRSTVPYETAMDLHCDKDEESAAPIVPEESAKAAVWIDNQSFAATGQFHSLPDELRPKLGPEI